MISITLRFASLMEEIVVDPMLTNLFAYNVNAKKILQCLMAKSSMVYAMLLFSLMVNAIQKTTMLSVVLMGVIVSLFKVIFGLFFLPFLTFKIFFPKAYCEYPEKYKDNICDDANNEEKCGFDGEDCCLGMLDSCEICMCHLIGNLGCLY